MQVAQSPMLPARAALLRELPDDAWFDVTMMKEDLRLRPRQRRRGGLVTVPNPRTGSEPT